MKSNHLVLFAAIAFGVWIYSDATSSSGSALKLNADNFDTTIYSAQPVLVDFYADY